MFRFTIRDVLWLMVVVGLVAGWMIDRSRFARREAMALENFYEYAPVDGLIVDEALFTEKLSRPISN